jgi:hypothetical protein
VLFEQSTFDPKESAAPTIATAARVGNGYMISVANRLAHMNGWAEQQLTAQRTGIPTSDAKNDVLTCLVREAAANSGNVTDKPAGATDRRVYLLYLGRRYSRDSSSTTRKPIWMACGRSSGADPAAPRESSLDLVIAGSVCVTGRLQYSAAEVRIHLTGSKRVS